MIRSIRGRCSAFDGLSIGCWVAVASAVCAAQADAQAMIEVTGDEPRCTCEISLEHVITLGDPEGPGALLGEIREVRRDSRGVYYVLAWREHQIYRFDPNGRALTPLFREGQGPGEASDVSQFLLVADSIFAFDPGNARVTVLDPGGNLVRTTRLVGSVQDAAYVPGRGIVVNTRGYEADSFGRAFHVVDFEGKRINSFGGEQMSRPDRGLSWVRRFSLAEGGLWSAFQDQYVISFWSLVGSRLSTLERKTDWFEPRAWDEQSWGGPDEPMKPSIMDIVDDDNGYIRTIIRRGGPRWAELLPPAIRRPADGGLVYPPEVGIGLFEAVIEVIDPFGGQLYAQAVLQQELYGFVDQDHVFSYALDDLGNPTVSIWRVRVEETSGR